MCPNPEKADVHTIGIQQPAQKAHQRNYRQTNPDEYACLKAKQLGPVSVPVKSPDFFAAHVLLCAYCQTKREIRAYSRILKQKVRKPKLI